MQKTMIKYSIYVSRETIEKSDDFLPLRLLVFRVEQREGFFYKVLLGQALRSFAQGMFYFSESTAHFGIFRPVADVVAVAEQVAQKRRVSGHVNVADIEFNKRRGAYLCRFSVGIEAVFLPVGEDNQVRVRVGVEVACNLFDKILVPVDIFEIQLFGFDQRPAVAVCGESVVHMSAGSVNRKLRLPESAVRIPSEGMEKRKNQPVAGVGFVEGITMNAVYFFDEPVDLNLHIFQRVLRAGLFRRCLYSVFFWFLAKHFM